MDCRIPYSSNLPVTIRLENSVPLSVSKTRGQPQRFTINSSKAYSTDLASAFLKVFSSTYLVNRSSKTIMCRLPVREEGFGPIISEATTIHGPSRFRSVCSGGDSCKLVISFPGARQCIRHFVQRTLAMYKFNIIHLQCRIPTG